MQSSQHGILNQEKSTDKLIWYFLIAWTILNTIQAYTLEIHADEAYYWLYSRFLDWGYFDHPPMVALFIRIGDSLVHSELGIRLMTVLSSSVSLFVLWRIVRQYQVEAKWFMLIVPGIFIFNIYGFMTTPDAPLFLFTVLFYLVFKKYQEAGSLKLALLLTLIITGLLYSKYHAVLLIGFTVLSDLKLLKRGSFWLIVILSGVLYLPHILWQVNHGYPSITYHLFEQSTQHYDFWLTWTYFPGQLLMAGPLIGWFLFYSAFRAKAKDAFTRCLMFNCVGTYVFFLVSSSRGEVQPQWTMIGFAPLVMLMLIHFKQANFQGKWFARLALVNVIFILAIRISIITASPLIRKIGQVKSLYGFKEWAQTIRQKVGDNYLIMDNGFQDVSKYDFYTNSTKGFAYDTRYYHFTQFDIWSIENGMQGKKAYFLTGGPHQGVSTDTLKTTTGLWFGGWVNDVRTYQQVKIEMPVYELKAAPGAALSLSLVIKNPYPYAINFSDAGYQHRVTLAACTFKGSEISVQHAGNDFHSIAIKPGQNANYTFKFTTPLQKGRYTMLFSLITDPFTGSKNSRIVNLTVE